MKCTPNVVFRQKCHTACTVVVHAGLNIHSLTGSAQLHHQHYLNDLLCIAVFCKALQEETIREVVPLRCSGCFCCVCVCDGAVERASEREIERESFCKVRRDAVLAHRKSERPERALESRDRGHLQRYTRSRGCLGVRGVPVLSQHAGLGAKLASLTRKSQAAEELCKTADFSFLCFSDCQQVQCAVPQAFPECSYRRDSDER